MTRQNMTMEESMMDSGAAVLGGVVAGGTSFIIADGIDRLLATYNPSATTPPPTDRFTSSGTGMLANSLNQGSMPGPLRIGAALALTAAPAIGAALVEDEMAQGALEAAAIGSGISALKMFWNNVIMPLLAPSDTSAPALQRSVICRLYPIEVAAHINTKAAQLAVSSAGSGALSGDSPYPSAGQALQLGTGGDSAYPTTEQALRAGVSGDSPYMSTHEALQHAAHALGVGAEPAAAPVVAEAVNKIAGEVLRSAPDVSAAQAVQAASAALATPHDVAGAMKQALPQLHPEHVEQIAIEAHPHVIDAHEQAEAYKPGPPSLPGPGPKMRRNSECGCVGAQLALDSFLGYTD